MAFISGQVSFSRFRVKGGAPKRLDDNLLEKLREHRIGSQRVLTADREESGWIGGRHLLDNDFDLEKNILLDCLHLGMRIDSHKPPPDLVRAYYQMEFDALYQASQGNGQGGRGRLARIKREAREAANDRVDREIGDGRYRKQRQCPVLIDTRESVLYAAATTPSVHERLHPLFKTTFGKTLEPMTAGQIAADWAEENGVQRMFENLEPSAFIPHPDGNGHNIAYWTSHDPEARDWLGNELLLWLWYHLSEEEDHVGLPDESDAAVVIVKQLTLECPWAETGKETITCDGPTRLPEARRAIQSGKLPRKAGLILSRHGQQYEFTLQAETFNVSGASLPKQDDDESANGSGHSNGNGNGNGNGQSHGRVAAEERLEQIRHLSESIDLLYGAFLKRRLARDWNETRDRIRTWLRSGAGE